MNILITGSSGYVGNVLVQHFASSPGKHKVIGFDVREQPKQKGLKRFTFFSGDIRDKEKIGLVLKKYKIDHVIHLAYIMEPQHDKQFEHDVDVNGSKALIDASLACPFVKQVIVFSSTSVYGAWSNKAVLHDEQTEMRPRSYEYAKNKKTVEEYIASLTPSQKSKGRKKVVVLRMCTVVGPQYYKHGGVVASLAHLPFGVNVGWSSTLIQFIHEEDLVLLVDKVVRDRTLSGVFNLCPDSFTTVPELARTIGKFCVHVPFSLMWGIFGMLWHLRLSTVSPPCVLLMRYGIVADPKKLISRYKYRFRYGSLAAFERAVSERRKNGTL